MRIKTCEMCGKEFTAKSNSAKYCCNECRKEANRTRNLQIYHEHKGGGRPKNPPKVRRKSRIDEINAKARAAGMTYGQYVAEEYKKTLRFSHD